VPCNVGWLAHAHSTARRAEPGTPTHRDLRKPNEVVLGRAFEPHQRHLGTRSLNMLFDIWRPVCWPRLACPSDLAPPAPGSHGLVVRHAARGDGNVNVPNVWCRSSATNDAAASSLALPSSQWPFVIPSATVGETRSSTGSPCDATTSGRVGGFAPPKQPVEIATGYAFP
jgi:hypothetical protein